MLSIAIKFCAIASKKQSPYTPFRASYITIKGSDGALHLQATDGHRVHSIKCRIDHNLPADVVIQVKADDLEQVAKAVGRREVSKVSLNLTAAPLNGIVPQAERENRRITFHLQNDSLSVEYFLSNFDPLHECQVSRPHEAVPVEIIGFDTGLLADAHKAFKMLNPVHGAVRFEFYGATSGTSLSPEFPPAFASLHDACIIIMPCRLD